MRDFPATARELADWLGKNVDQICTFTDEELDYVLRMLGMDPLAMQREIAGKIWGDLGNVTPGQKRPH